MTFSFGKDFKFTIFGESHGQCVGVVVEGCPAGLEISGGDIQRELERRRPGTGPVSTRHEGDAVRIMSGVTAGRANGGPIMALVSNVDVDSSWYERNRFLPRPGHADYTAFVKYGGFNDYRGGGFFSGRMTVGMVIAGAIAKKILSAEGVRIFAHLIQLGSVRVAENVGDEEVEAIAAKSPLWCASEVASQRMLDELAKAASDGDSLGGVVECRATGVPPGIGEPLFDSVESVVSHGLFSIPAVKGVEFGGGFSLSRMRGSEANDGFAIIGGKVLTKTNNSGGILGGISNGMPIVVRVIFKPTPSIAKTQRSVDLSKMEGAEIRVEGRHDPCVAVRGVPVVEGMVAVSLADLMSRAHKISRVEGV
uniref:Chorismate synthase n=1 Tax=Candidatus Methanomethylicus mesodigestus TaxID=1867258 RepID=A0A7C3ERV6_9CREN